MKLQSKQEKPLKPNKDGWKTTRIDTMAHTVLQFRGIFGISISLKAGDNKILPPSASSVYTTSINLILVFL
ncbi:hypothetical protein COV81_04895 [Candidatus Peregrinibacteria bacterium CG11_big_fil_rev_8_21_14_0_20_41_10]|nr:MAG: hypothetical protein COV81_04895 [Candidatus Peregrinibacteria bacterium CG11_big_fil_rev_8_21_14_0_20_41_10]PIZ77796.1 MAG: hypothetical protein COY06_00200 [Candidatus Peregrinibacteria bacterium CG_4_10_14_0_2_um_filter_41_8]PJC38399.1 MAG: hypothetical protein CO045_00470 [Candidatus Peregrinibacteria bacterium CG_4_9_14_0_2_um_filter_41_14]